jgi:phosphonate transport system ATP-binding protein
MSLLHLHEAHAAFGNKRVLGPISLQVAPGERVALVGRSGAGKSTLLSLMYDQVRAQAALMPQELGLVQSLSVFHNVFMGRLSANPTWYNIANLVRPFRRELDAIRPLLEKLAIADKLRVPAGALSGGQKQRTAVARSLYQRAEILLADEPVSALDGPLAHTVMAALTETYGTAVIAMHDVELALRYTTRIVGISDGVVALDEPSGRLSPRDLLPLY